MYTLLYNQLQFFHFTLSKIILMKFAKLRNFVLSFIILWIIIHYLNLGAEGCIWQYFGRYVRLWSAKNGQLNI